MEENISGKQPNLMIYLIRRLLQGAAALFIVATVVFLLMRLFPKDYYFTEEQMMKLSEEQRSDILRAEGLMDPVPVQLFRWYGKMLSGDFGVSRRLQAGIPVAELIRDRAGISFRIGMIALFLSLLLGFGLGILQVVHAGRFADHLGKVFTVLIAALPNLVIFSVVLAFGANVLKLPVLYSGRRNTAASLVMPVVCLCLPSTAGYAIWIRRYMKDEMGKDYVRTAVSKGLSRRQVIMRHVLRNAVIPMLQYLPSSVLLTISGSFLVERFFSIPGMGTLLLDAIGRYDLDVVQTLVTLYAGLSILGVLLGDLLMAAADPRIRLGGGARGF